jgi:hypothetical protein
MRPAYVSICNKRVMGDGPADTSAFRGAGGPQALTMFHLLATNPVLHRTTLQQG